MIQSKPELSDYYDGDLTKDAIEAEIKDQPNPMPPIMWIAILVSAVVVIYFGYPFFKDNNFFENFFHFLLAPVAGAFVFTAIYMVLGIVTMFGQPHPFDQVENPYLEELKLALISINSYEKDLLTWKLYNLETGQQYWLGLRGRNLENATANLLNRIGWECKTTAVTGDGGIDLIASKGSTEVLIQCKGHAARIGVGTIRDAAGVKAVQNKPFVVIAPIGFTQGSQDFADLSGVKLVNVFDLVKIAQDARWLMAESF